MAANEEESKWSAGERDVEAAPPPASAPPPAAPHTHSPGEASGDPADKSQLTADASVAQGLTEFLQSCTAKTPGEPPLVSHTVDPLVSHTMDPEGSLVSHTVDPEGSLVSHTVDPEGSLVSHTVDPEGSLVSHTMDPEGSLISHTVDSEGHLVSHTVDPEGSLVTHMDTEGSLVTHTMDPEGSLVTHTMDSASLVDCGQVEQAVFTGTSAEYTTVSAELVNALSSTTTIIYVQPDGSFLEGSGLTAEEHQALVEQLTNQQVVQVSETEAARLFEHNQVLKTIPSSGMQFATLAPNELQQVIDQVTKSQLGQSPAPQKAAAAARPAEQQQQQVVAAVDASGVLTVRAAPVEAAAGSGAKHHQVAASQQLKNVAKQVAIQAGNTVRLSPRKVRGHLLLSWSIPTSTIPELTTITILELATSIY